MMNYKQVLFLLAFIAILLCVPLQSHGQTVPCAFDEMQDSFRRQQPAEYYLRQFAHRDAVKYFRQRHPGPNYLPNPSLPSGGGSFLIAGSCRQAKYVVPVIVHIIYDTQDSINGNGSFISDAQVQNAIDELNNDFANAANAPWPAVNTGIQFCLAKVRPDGSPFSGITRRASSLSIHKRPMHEDTLKTLDYFPADQYVNIWVVKDIQTNSGVTNGVVGYGTFPGTKPIADGIVMRYDFMGNYFTYGAPLNPDSRGDVLSHEMGHYLGLYHPWEGGSCAGNTAATCAITGDLACDVPPTTGANTISCDTSRNTCTESPDRRDLIENYMDYTVSCKTLFTSDQTDIMHSVLTGKRFRLAQTSNVNRLNLSCCLMSARFNGSGYACKDSIINMEALEYTGVTYTWRVYRNGSLVQLYINTNNIVAIKGLDTGKYDLRLTVRSGNDSAVEYSNQALQVVDCSQRVHSTQGNWYFGHYGGLRFVPGGPIRDYSVQNATVPGNTPENLDAVEGCITVSDTSGNMLFYGGHWEKIGSEVFNVYDRKYVEMFGSPVKGNYTASQGCVTFPRPGDPTGQQYFLVTHDFLNVYLSLIDLSLTGNGTSGEIAWKDTIVRDSLGQTGWQYYEAMTAISRCDGDDYWVVVPGRKGENGLFYLVVFRADNTGLHFHSSCNMPVYFETDAFEAQMKFSPDGNMLSYYNYLFDFDRSTGMLTLRHTETFDFPFELRNVWSVCFSPDNTKMYRSIWYVEYGSDNIHNNFELYQYDLTSSAPNLGRMTVLKLTQHKTMQLGPDGKIYLNNDGLKYLSVISNPNQREYGQNECGFETVGVAIADENIDILCMLGLPNMVDAKDSVNIQVDFYASTSNCTQITFHPNTCCTENYKWYFGDGDSSVLKAPVHNYLEPGLYAVTLIADGISRTKLIEVGIVSHVSMIADSNICDTASFMEVSIASVNPAYSYTWSAVNGTLSASGIYPYSAQVKWNNNGSLKLLAVNPNTGCRDSAIQNIRLRSIINGNTISYTTPGGFPYVCPSDTSFTITGGTATSPDTVISYEWYSSGDGVFFSSIPGSNSKDWKPFVGGLNARDTIFMRRAYTKYCFANSNLAPVSLSVTSNIISGSPGVCLGSSVNLNGLNAGTAYAIGTWNYQWQKSYDSITWTNIPGATSQNLNTTLDNDFVYYRRLVVSTGVCESPSNVVKVGVALTVASQPQDVTVCGLGAPYFMSLGMDNPNGLSLSYTWEIKPSGSLSWSFLGSGNPLNTVSGVSFTNGDTIRCVISSTCGTLYSEQAILYVNNLSPSLSTMLDKSVSEGSSLTLSLATTPTTGNTYNWQVSYDGGTSWITVQTGSDNTLIINPVQTCDAGLYRAFVSNVCGSVMSNTVTVTVAQTRTWDIWMRDAWADNGTEGDSSVAYSIYNSPDLWVRYKQDGVTQHQSPVRDYFPGQPNYVYARIRNKGSVATPASELYLYWTKASTDERWSFDWTASFGNRALNWLDGQTYPLGSEINTTPITIPAIAPGDSVIISYPWIPPSPSWFMFFENGQPRIESKSHICLLSRVVTCPTPQYGMANEEVEEVRLNITKNNNIATRNTSVSRIDVGNPVRTTGITKVPNYGLQLDTQKLVVKVNTPDVFNNVRIIMHLDDELASSWLTGGQNLYGMIKLTNNTVELTASEGGITDLRVPAGSVGYFYFEFKLKPNVTVLDVTYDVEIQQWNGGTEPAEYRGSVHHQVTAYSLGFGMGKKATTSITQTTGSSNWVNIYPNPFSGQTMIVFDLDKAEQVSIDLYDVTGKLVQTIPGKRYEAGQHQEIINAAGLADGIYYCRIKAGSKLLNEKLVLLKAQ